MEKYNIQEEDLEGSKEKAREAIDIGVHIKMYSNVNNAREGRSKLNFFLDGKATWTAEEPAEYMKKLTRKQVSTIFKARTRMTKVKGNYKNEYPDQTCRACKNHPETHLHALYECTSLNPNPPVSTDTTNILDIFCDYNTDELKIVAKKIDEICEKLTEL